MAANRSKTSRKVSTEPARAGASSPRAVSLRLRWLAGIGLLLAIAAWWLRSSDGLRERILRIKDLPTLQEMVRRQPDDALAQSYLGKRAYQAQDYTEAASAYAAAVRLRPHGAEAHFGYGLALYRLGQTRAAQTEFEQAFQENDRLAGAEMMLGALAWSRGDLKQGLERARHAARLAPQDAKIWWLLARFYLQRNRQGEAIDALQKALAQRETSPAYHTALGEALLATGKPLEARSHFERALQLDPNYGQARAQLGGFYLSHVPGRDALEKAEALLQRATQLETLAPGEVAFQLGQVYAQQGRFKEAVAAFEEAIRRGYDDEKVYYALANAQRRLGNVKAAEANDRLFHQKSELRLQIPGLEKRVKAVPGDATAHLRLAQGYRYIQWDSQAIQQYAIYLRLRPDDTQRAEEYTQYARRLNLESNKLLPVSDTPEPL